MLKPPYFFQTPPISNGAMSLFFKVDCATSSIADSLLDASIELLESHEGAGGKITGETNGNKRKHGQVPQSNAEKKMGQIMRIFLVIFNGFLKNRIFIEGGAPVRVKTRSVGEHKYDISR